MRKIKLILILLICCSLITGCAETKILERISLVTLIGYDNGDEDKVTATTVVRQINPEFESRVETQTETEATSKGTRIKVDMKTAKKLAAGQLRVVLYGEELAKQGIEESIQTLLSNSEISTSVYLAVVRGESKTLIEQNYEGISDIGQHLYNLIDHNIEQQQLISSTLHEIGRDNQSKVRNFALPILKKEGQFIGITGTAFFNKGKMVGELPSSDISYLVLICDSFKSGTLELSLDSESISPTVETKGDTLNLAVDSIKSKSIIKVTDAKKNEFDLNILLKCRLLETSNKIDISDPKVNKTIEKAMNEKIESEISRIIKYTKEIESDIFGFGEEYRSQVRGANLTEEKWMEMYKKMKLNINVDVEIIRNGVYE
ncbi:Ger(x)C family spore germination protein [Ureibacillus chungkukjangi]|uniref:Spore germination protein n=1 Tax=Ureibacillus chungkukjangi TaxID=1202712 RepID=A0A318TLG1_9BACL|nr:Ger(x)C family spore germination protein [Ureibacillus chungkukjangi]MCM3387842.1 Ger(x)C family spore germination protein [Ureibacillus chungkukjangi]PYF05682.1 spore germination protein [Ureibacillus chungkukjangi]